MPTSFTEPVIENESETLEKFVLRCARAFGPMIMLREYSFDAPIPEDLGFGQKSYHEERFEKEQEYLAVLQQMTSEEYFESERPSRDRLIAEFKRNIEKGRMTSQRLQNMLTKVKCWTAPSKDHEGLKDYMIDQLTRELEYETKEDFWLEQIESYNNRKADVDHAMAIENAKRSVEYHQEHAARDRAQKEFAINWYQQLKASL